MSEKNYHAEAAGHSILHSSTYPLLIDGDPVCALEPLVILDVVDAVLEVPVPLREVHLQQVLQEVLQLGGEVRGKSNLRRESATE